MVAKINSAVTKAFEIKPDSINGLKTFVGVLLVVAAHSLNATKELIVMLPDVAMLTQIQDALILSVTYCQKILTILGGGFLGVGVMDKIIKFIKGIFAK